MKMSELWKSQEKIDQEKKKQEIAQIHQENQQKAQSLLTNRIAEDYLLAKDVSGEEKDIFTSLFNLYQLNKEYKTGNKFNYNGDIYEVIQEHTSQEEWKPNELPALYRLFYQLSTSDGTNVIPDWQEPIGDTLTYPTGALVAHKEKLWVSVVDDNVWEPGVYGWEEYIVEQQ